MRRLVAVCGTLGGLSRHRRLGEKPCRACLDADNEHRRIKLNYHVQPSPTDGPPMPRFGEDALCRQTDPDIFFPPKGGSVIEAKAVCGHCDYLLECRAWAIAYNIPGIWGATTGAERRRIRRTAGISAIPLRGNGEDDAA